MRILAISGSLQAQSKNLALLTAAATVAPPGVDVVVFDGIRDLPHFNPDFEAMAAPESVLRWRQALAASDAVLIVFNAWSAIALPTRGPDAIRFRSASDPARFRPERGRR